MKRTCARVLVMSLPLLASCGGSAPSTSEALGTSSSAMGAEEANSPLYVYQSGHFSSGGEDGTSTENFWTDLSVRDDAYSKQVGVVWSSDSWQTTHTAMATYKQPLGSGREQWHVEQDGFAGIMDGQSIEVAYAGFVTMNGTTSWSEFRNHYIYQPVFPATPVRLLSSGASLTSSGAPELTGKVRALNVSGTRNVWVRYTTNSWASYRDVQATFDGTDFPFQIPLSISAATTESASLAVRLDAEGQSAWDSNGGQNYTVQLAPVLTTQLISNDPGRPAGGVRTFSATIGGAIPISQAWVHMDGGPRIVVPSQQQGTSSSWVGFSAQGAVNYLIDSTSLSAGAHTISVEVQAGPFVRAFAPVSFQVEKGISFGSSWVLGQPQAQPDSWAFASDASGHVYVGGTQGVRVYPSFGSTAAPTAFATAPMSGYISGVSLDSTGRVYAIAAETIGRWLPSGAVDTTFGSSGALSFASGTWGTEAFCYASDMVVSGTHLFVDDSCNARVLRLTLDGTFVDELDLASGATWANVQKTVVDASGDLWVLRTFEDSSNTMRQTLLHLSTPSTGSMTVKATITLDPEIPSIASFAIAASGEWVTDAFGNLYFADPTGAPTATWLSGGAIPALPDTLGVTNCLTISGAKGVSVMSTDTNRISQFELN